jgi:hypothetical protein
MTTCPFCQFDPYHYEHNGLGYERVAVVCCELGIDYFQHQTDQKLAELGSRISNIMFTIKCLQEYCDDLRKQAEDHVNAQIAGQVTA